MNKKIFIKELANRLNLSLEKSTTIDTILETDFFISKKRKDKIVVELKKQLEIEEQEANNIYLTAVQMWRKEIEKNFTNSKEKE